MCITTPKATYLTWPRRMPYIAEARAFLDGNKRVGAAAALAFLDGNGVTVPPPAPTGFTRP
jgi:hypothetical protein